jgi:hypothetical protein
MLRKNYIFKTADVPVGKLYKEKYEEKNFFTSLKSLRKGVGSGYGSAPKCHGSPTLLPMLFCFFSYENLGELTHVRTVYRKIYCLISFLTFVNSC